MPGGCHCFFYDLCPNPQPCGHHQRVPAPKRERPGISSYADEPQKAGESLTKCLDEAMTIIPLANQPETSVSLGATGGMMLLRFHSPEAAQRILDEVSRTIQKYPGNFRGAHILTGLDEGAYNWVTVNYLLHSFMTYSFNGVWVRPATTHMYGALDLGDVATLISFIPNVNIEDKREEATLRLYGVNYTIYTHSYFCYGVHPALKKLLLQAIVGKNLVNPIIHPCYPDGYMETVPLTSLYESPCTHHLAFSLYKPDLSGNITLVGGGDAFACRSLTKQIFNFSACGKKQSCSFDGVYQPPVSGKFLAFSGFYDIFNFLNLTKASAFQDVYRKLKEFCSINWNQLRTQYPYEREDWLRDSCGIANYILTLLLDVYKFTEDTWNNIIFQKQVDKTDIGWTLGHMLNLTNMIPAEATVNIHGQDYRFWTAAIFFIVFALALSVIMLIIYMKC
ncbi:ectonucleoside triphosphate diphosphohydrolase 8-like isoform X2 [Pleurodeles waltl]|uniref:ectonucleoside triphosphate diphosphohydrolase 8-like isoform X2 n=1 Tax=Pleurodeles waltl TaxID=8319 RepID=UPI0037098456